MADAPEPKGGSGTFGFLGKKVFGKVPIWVIAVGAVGGYYWYTHYGPGKKAAAQQPQTDPAGNVCAAINPDTGYCPGSVEDTAALQAQAAAGGAGTGADTAGTPEPPEPPEPPETGPIPRGHGPKSCPPGTHRVIIGEAGRCVPDKKPPPVHHRRRPPRRPRVTSNWPGGRQPVPVTRPGITPPPSQPVGPVHVYAPGTHGSVYASTG